MPGIIEDAPTAGGGGDELDDLFDYDVSAEDLFRTAQEQADRKVGLEAATQKKPADLGLDEEIKVERKRAPIAKLDIERLLSPKGIPKLRRITKDRLKFKGKGHEYTDVARLLNLYQLWLDDLYPRAKFADGLAIIEKLGHQKRLQVMRKEWIDESKPKDIWADNADAADEDTEQSRPQPDNQASDNVEPSASSVEHTASEHQKTRDNDDLFLTDDEAGEASMQPPEDELDALLAEDVTMSSATGGGLLKKAAPDNRTIEPQHDEFEDDMEAMAEMDMW